MWAFVWFFIWCLQNFILQETRLQSFWYVLNLCSTDLIAFHLVHFLNQISQGLAALVKFQRSRRLLGVCYIVVKVIFIFWKWQLSNLSHVLPSLVFYTKLIWHFLFSVKVSLLVVVEIGVFPLICGWWLDICSLVRIGTFGMHTLTSFI